MSQDALGDRMKMYEQLGIASRFLPRLPVLARIDGRAFHSFTRDLQRPYDYRLSNMMIELTKKMVADTGALIGYTQSDEVSLVWYSEDPKKSQIYFDGRPMKMISQLSATATLIFYEAVKNQLPQKYAERRPTFDARVWVVPTKAEAANYLRWREQDATKNSINMAAHAMRKPGENLDGMNGSQLQEFLFQRGINWNTYPDFFKRGTYVQRKTVEKKFEPCQIEKLPQGHQARSNPGMTYTRSVVAALELAPFGATEAVIFGEAL